MSTLCLPLASYPKLDGLHLKAPYKSSYEQIALQEQGFKAVKHQSFEGTGYFDAVQNTIQQGASSIIAMEGSTETAQFH